MQEEFLRRITEAVTELAKGMKASSFYPPGHPNLVHILSKITQSFEEIPLPESGLDVGVSKNALSHGNVALPTTNKAVVDLNRELYVRRVSKLFILPGTSTQEMAAFLLILARDARELADEGGVEKALHASGVTHIFANRVDYEAMTENLKGVRPEPVGTGDDLVFAGPPINFEQNDTPFTADTLDDLLSRIERETNAPAYRGHIVALARIICAEPAGLKLVSAQRAFSIFARHIERPPKGVADIAALAKLGIKEMATDEILRHHVDLLSTKSTAPRGEVETILAACEEKSAKFLVALMAETEDLIVRKSVVDILVRIGRAGLPTILDFLNDSRWYMVRNVVSVLGSLGMTDVAPQIAAVISHPDVRVKKEAIKALSKLEHPVAVTTLCELCFFPDSGIALAAIAALSTKKETEAVLTLYRRAIYKNVMYPIYRLAHEAVDSLKTIGTEEALLALADIMRMGVFLETKRFRELKLHALQSIARIKVGGAREILRKAAESPNPRWIRAEAERLLKAK